MAGAEAVVLDTAQADGYLLAPEQLEEALTPKSRVLILCSPSNPTGTVYDEARLRVRTLALTLRLRASSSTLCADVHCMACPCALPYFTQRGSRADSTSMLCDCLSASSSFLNRAKPLFTSSLLWQQ